MLNNLVLILLTVSLLASLYLFVYKQYSRYRDEQITRLISIIAIWLSIFSLFGGSLFPFIVEERSPSGIFFYKNPINPVNESPFIILPVVLNNSSYGSGIVEYVYLVITDPNNKKYSYLPNVEIDTHQLIAGNKGLDVSSIKNIIQPIYLRPREIIYTNILFQDNESHKWLPGNYNFELYIKLSNEDDFKKVAASPFKMNKERIDTFEKGILYYFPLQDYRTLREKITKQVLIRESTNQP